MEQLLKMWWDLVGAGFPCTSIPAKPGEYSWCCHARCEPRALAVLGGGCTGKPPLPLPWEQWENSMAATAHCLGALLLQELSLLGCLVLHGCLVKVREVVLHVWKMQLSSWSWGKCSWEPVPLLLTNGASLPGVSNGHLMVKSTVGSPFCLNPKLPRVFLAVKPDCVLGRERKGMAWGHVGNRTT